MEILAGVFGGALFVLLVTIIIGWKLEKAGGNTPEQVRERGEYAVKAAKVEENTASFEHPKRALIEKALEKGAEFFDVNEQPLMDVAAVIRELEKHGSVELVVGGMVSTHLKNDPTPQMNKTMFAY